MTPKLKQKKEISIVVPVFNEELCLHEFYIEVCKSLKRYRSWEVLFVDDGSTDSSWQKILEISSKDERVRAIRFTRNFGHQVAVLAGLAEVDSPFIAIIDADLQDPPSLIPQMRSLVKDGVEMVYGRRVSREGETWFKKFSAKVFYRIFQSLVPFDVPLDTGDFRVISQKVKNQVIAMNERDPFLRGLFALTGYRSVAFDYVRSKRFSGETKYGLRKMMSLAVNAVLTFSDFPLRLFTRISFLLLSVSTIFGCWAILNSFFGGAISGWLSIFVLVLFLGSLNTVFLAIMGSYLLQTLKASRFRPIYFVSERIR